MREDETRENCSPLSTVNILGVTNLNQFSTVQYSVILCAQIIVTFKLVTDITKHELCFGKNEIFVGSLKFWQGGQSVNVKITEELKTTPICRKK